MAALLLASSCVGVPVSTSCNGRGSLLPSGGCRCKAGWAGDACERYACKRECSGHGLCLRGLCVCDGGWVLDDCSERNIVQNRCPSDCWGVGICDPFTGKCSCGLGFSGDDCGVGICPRNCSGNGVCVPGAFSESAQAFVAGGCECHRGYTGHDCALTRCPDDCSGHGRCVDGTCACDRGYAGTTCGEAQCATPCFHGGACVGGGHCRCAKGFGGADCSLLAPPPVGTLRSHAVAASAEPAPVEALAAPSSGAVVESAPAPRPPHVTPCAGRGVCSGRGRCVNSTCECDAGYGGAACEQRVCAADSSALG